MISSSNLSACVVPRLTFRAIIATAVVFSTLVTFTTTHLNLVSTSYHSSDRAAAAIGPRGSDRGNGGGGERGECYNDPTQRRARNTTRELIKLTRSLDVEAHADYCLEQYPGSGYVAVRDRILPESVTHAGRKIPRVVHVTSKDRCLPAVFAETVESWKLDGYSLYFHDDAAVLALLELRCVDGRRTSPELPDLAMAAACVRSGAGLADLWRYVVIYEYGGMYTDIDNLPREKLHADGEGIDPAFEAVFAQDQHQGYPSQYWFAAMPRHPLLYFIVHTTFLRLYELEDVEGQFVPYITGPGAFVRGWSRFSNATWKAGKGRYVGYGNYTANCLASRRDHDLWVKRAGVANLQKARYYRRANITGHRTHIPENRARLVTCFENIRETFFDRGY